LSTVSCGPWSRITRLTSCVTLTRVPGLRPPWHARDTRHRRQLPRPCLSKSHRGVHRQCLLPDPVQIPPQSAARNLVGPLRQPLSARPQLRTVRLRAEQGRRLTSESRSRWNGSPASPTPSPRKHGFGRARTERSARGSCVPPDLLPPACRPSSAFFSSRPQSAISRRVAVL
jgi:hypothetical protein